MRRLIGALIITSHEATIRYDEIVEHVTPRIIILYHNAHNTVIDTFHIDNSTMPIGFVCNT
ncbi:NmrA-like family protein [Aspergillus luchuensis]|uniref:NmrA-like family protein n=1 Tax=Aspergillus kawachii TaxID=1069201 RepID=A0A146FQY5_ASPKA|nr:NmrA-like family protein [Aspergillus luchuensis]